MRKTILSPCLLATIAILGFLISCGSDQEPTPSSKEEISEQGNEGDASQKSAQDKAKLIINESVHAAGLSGFNSAAVQFRFRDKQYRYQRHASKFKYERWWQDTLDGQNIRDVLTNNGLTRYINGIETEIPDKKRKAYRNSVNSVIYFAFMPWVLKDPAVVPTYEGQENIKGEVLDRVRVDFEEENGGSDNKDEFLYWFTPETRQLKYLAYSHPGGAMPRFRVANNERTVDGITVRDYHNYTTADKSARTIDKLAEDYNAGKLILLSEINLENVQMVPIDD